MSLCETVFVIFSLQDNLEIDTQMNRLQLPHVDKIMYPSVIGDFVPD